GVGREIRRRGGPLEIVGGLDRKGQTTGGTDQDDAILLPLSTAKKKILGVSKSSPRAVHAIAVKIRAGEDMDEAETQLRTLLRQRHRIKPGQDDDFWLPTLAAW